MDIPGYTMNILYVDLTNGGIRKGSIDPELVRTFIGGWGISLKLAYDLIPPKADALSPENAIIVGTGPFTGTIVPGSAKTYITTKFPINGAIATASGGGLFSCMLKFSGYDQLVITGRSQKPVYLKILDDDIELLDASDLWGKDTYDTVDELRNRHEPCSVIPTGQAGENLVSISVTSVDKGGSIGRGGLPAVMGSKSLKAIVAAQGSAEIEVADRLRLQSSVDHLVARMMAWPMREQLLNGGFAKATIEWSGFEPVVTKNFTEVHILTSEEQERYNKFLADYAKSRKPLACVSCLLADKEIVKQPDMLSYGNLLGEMADEFSRESAMEGLPKAMKCGNALNRFGIDYIDYRSLLSLIFYLYEQGIITKEDTGGLELRNDVSTALKLVKMVAYRQGIGDVLADGIEEAVKKLGKGAEHAFHIKNHGIVLPFDPRVRGFGTMELTQMTNPRGAHVNAGGSPSYMPGRPHEDFIRHAERMGANDGAVRQASGHNFLKVGRYMKFCEDWYSLSNCMNICLRAMNIRFYTVKTIAELYAAITGIEASVPELIEAADRCWNLYKALNDREGFSRKHDEPPEIWFQPLKGEDKEYHMMDYFRTTVMTKEDVSSILDDYYEARGWDKETGHVTAGKLKELGLENHIK